MSVFVSGYPAMISNDLNWSVGPAVHDTACVFLLAVSRALNLLLSVYMSKYLTVCIYSIIINILQIIHRENSVAHLFLNLKKFMYEPLPLSPKKGQGFYRYIPHLLVYLITVPLALANKLSYTLSTPNVVIFNTFYNVSVNWLNY